MKSLVPPAAVVAKDLPLDSWACDLGCDSCQVEPAARMLCGVEYVADAFDIAVGERPLRCERLFVCEKCYRAMKGAEHEINQ